MAHNLFTAKNGLVSAAYAIDEHGLPWHELGQMVNHAMTWKEAYELAQLDWTVEKRPLFFKNPLWKPGSTVPKGYVFPNQFGIFRSDLTGKESALGIVGNTYEPTQNIEIGGWIDNVLEQIDGAHYEAAGVLGRGERVWALARVPFNASIGNDKHETFIMFMSAHDGTMSNTIMLTDVRVVCQNTLNFALSKGTKDAMIKVRHTKGAKEKLNKITTEIQTGLKQDINSLKEKFEKIITHKVTKELFAQTMTRIFGEKWEQSDKKSDKALEIAKLFNDNDDNAIPEQAGTGMALVNAVTNYVDHKRPSRVTSTSGYTTQEQARADSAWVGSGAQLKSNALETVLELIESPEETSHNPNPTVQMKEKNETLDKILDLVG